MARERPGSFGVLDGSDGGEARPLCLRARNLGVDRWALWARAEGVSLLDDLGAPDVRWLVVDLGSPRTREKQALAAGSVLRTLWRRRADRQPVLVVIDEAHDVCPEHTGDALTALAAQDAIRIGGEGRKYGLYLLLATQRPQKLHEHLLSQCDNLLLMRMNSAADLVVVGAAFSFVAPGLLERATAFRQGEAIAAGAIASHPAFIRFGARISHGGGADVAATWAQPRGA